MHLVLVSNNCRHATANSKIAVLLCNYNDPTNELAKSKSLIVGVFGAELWGLMQVSRNVEFSFFLLMFEDRTQRSDSFLSLHI